jgi:hypothetical protein
MSWINSVHNAISEVEINHPGLAARVAALPTDSDSWSDGDWNDYNEAAGAIVEPFNFPGGSSDEEEFYYEKGESEGFGFVNGVIDQVEDPGTWGAIIDLVNEIGY